MRKRLLYRVVNDDVAVVLTTDQAPGAWQNGTRIRKAVYELGDMHAVGALGKIIGSMGPDKDGAYNYFVEWDDHPDLPVFVTGKRIRPIW